MTMSWSIVFLIGGIGEVPVLDAVVEEDSFDRHGDRLAVKALPHRQIACQPRLAVDPEQAWQQDFLQDHLAVVVDDQCFIQERLAVSGNHHERHCRHGRHAVALPHTFVHSHRRKRQCKTAASRGWAWAVAGDWTPRHCSKVLNASTSRLSFSSFRHKHNCFWIQATYALVKNVWIGSSIIPSLS